MRRYATLPRVVFPRLYKMLSKKSYTTFDLYWEYYHKYKVMTITQSMVRSRLVSMFKKRIVVHEKRKGHGTAYFWRLNDDLYLDDVIFVFDIDGTLVYDHFGESVNKKAVVFLRKLAKTKPFEYVENVKHVFKMVNKFVVITGRTKLMENLTIRWFEDYINMEKSDVDFRFIGFTDNKTYVLEKVDITREIATKHPEKVIVFAENNNYINKLVDGLKLDNVVTFQMPRYGKDEYFMMLADVILTNGYRVR